MHLLHTFIGTANRTQHGVGVYLLIIYDDVIKWKRFSHYLPHFQEDLHFPHIVPITQKCHVFFDVRSNTLLNQHSTCRVFSCETHVTSQQCSQHVSNLKCLWNCRHHTKRGPFCLNPIMFKIASSFWALGWVKIVYFYLAAFCVTRQASHGQPVFALITSLLQPIILVHIA